MDAEDVVQEVFLVLQESSLDHIGNLKAYVCRSVHNRSLNRLKARGGAKESYIGPELPEPIVTETLQMNDPLETFLLKESMSTAYLLLLRKLSVNERIVFVLREALRFSFDDIAGIVGKTSNNCRQILYRAKKNLGEMPGPSAPSQEVAGNLVKTFVQSLLSGDTDRMLSTLSQDAVLYADSGGKMKAPLRPLFGSIIISRFFDGIRSDVPDHLDYELKEINGRPGLVFQADRQPFAVMGFHFDDSRIAHIYFMLNPDKLHHLGA